MKLRKAMLLRHGFSILFCVYQFPDLKIPIRGMVRLKCIKNQEIILEYRGGVREMAKYQLEIYTRPTCSDCQDLKKFLESHQIPHKQYDLAKQPDKEKDLIRITGNRIVPGLVFSQPSFLGLMKKPKSMIGFERNKDEIKKLLNVG